MTDATSTHPHDGPAAPRLAIDVLDEDWRRLQTTPLLRASFAAWRRTDAALASFASPAALIYFLHAPGDPDAKDRALYALLSRAHSEPVAARVVLQALRPALKGLAGRLLIDVRDRDELWSLLIGTAWEKICAYPVARRPFRVAANLRLDTLHSVLAQVRAERDTRAHLQSAQEVDSTPSAGGTLRDSAAAGSKGDVDALLERAVAAGAINAREAELIAATRIDGTPLVALAAQEQVKPDTLKHRRHRAERRLLLFLGVSHSQERIDVPVLLGCPARGLWASPADQPTGTRR